MRQGGEREGEREEEEEGTPLRINVHQLQGNVQELTEYYNELMDAFEKLKSRQGETIVSPLLKTSSVCE